MSKAVSGSPASDRVTRQRCLNEWKEIPCINTPRGHPARARRAEDYFASSIRIK